MAETRADGGCTTLDSNAIVVLGGKKSGWTFKTVEILVEGSSAWKFGKQSFFFSYITGRDGQDIFHLCI